MEEEERNLRRKAEELQAVWGEGREGQKKEEGGRQHGGRKGRRRRRLCSFGLNLPRNRGWDIDFILFMVNMLCFTYLYILV